MEFKDKYTNAKDKEVNKIELTNDAYAITEFIDILIKKIEHARTSLMK